MKLCSGSALHCSIHQHCEQNRTGYKKKMMKIRFFNPLQTLRGCYSNQHTRGIQRYLLPAQQRLADCLLQSSLGPICSR